MAALMSAAGASGVVADHSHAGEPATVLPDAELLNLCREVVGCDRIANAERNGQARFETVEIKNAMSRLNEACRTKARTLPRIVEMAKPPRRTAQQPDYGRNHHQRPHLRHADADPSITLAPYLLASQTQPAT